MPITTLDRITALFASLEPGALDQLTPVERERFGHLCRRWAELAERAQHIVDGAGEAPAPPRSGVLADLRDGRGRR